MKPILIGAASDLGVHINGASKGPEIIINNIDNINKVLKKQDTNYQKSLAKEDLRKNFLELNKYNENLYKTILEYNQNYFPITIGGDHSISIASILASCKKNTDIGIIWVDAHPDFNTLDTTITGNIHGLPLASVANYYNAELTFFHNDNFVNPKNIVIIGARSIDELELVNLQKAGVTYFTTKDIKEYGCKDIVDKAFKKILTNTNKIHISFDLDVIDPTIAPGVSIPEIDGITKEEALTINKLLLEKIDNIVSFDLVEYNPLKDKDNQTLDIANNILNEVLKKILN